MGVQIEWKLEGEGRAGLVAEGAYLWDAAKRLGVRLPAECEGRGECDTCAVVVEEGATLLSALTEAERARLSPERLLAGERLACQAKLERGGAVVVRPVPATEREETTEESVRDIRKEFRDMPLRKKFTTLVELEAAAAIHTFVALADLPFAALEKGLDFVGGFGRAKAQRQKRSRRPAEHRAADSTRAGSKGKPDGEKNAR